jgi:hypothetical protein
MKNGKLADQAASATGMSAPPQTSAGKWRETFRRRRRRHDPMLVLNMSTFNFDHGWSQIVNPMTHEDDRR